MNFKYITTTPGLGGRIKQYSEDFCFRNRKNYETDVLYLPKESRGY